MAWTWTPESSAFARVGWDRHEGQLGYQFRGNPKMYRTETAVPDRVARYFLAETPSKGRYFSKHLRGQY